MASKFVKILWYLCGLGERKTFGGWKHWGIRMLSFEPSVGSGFYNCGAGLEELEEVMDYDK